MNGWELAAAVAGGLVSGLFGGGGGMAALPLLAAGRNGDTRQTFAQCLALMLPICCLSGAVHLWAVRPGPELILPCMAGGLAGGVVGGLTFRRVPAEALRLGFGAVLLLAGGRYLLW